MADPIYGGVDVPSDVWGVDTCVAGVLSDAQLDTLAGFDLATLHLTGPCGKPRVLWGYGPLSGAKPSAWDWTAERMRAAMDRGFLVGLVQHCRGGLWTASPELGRADGEAIAAFADDIGYASDCHIAGDDEAVRNPGPEAYAHVAGWCEAVDNASRPPCVYEGFDSGLSPADQYRNPWVHRYWGALGPWQVATRGVCCRQGPTVRIGGVSYDLDHFFADKLGGVLRLMGRVDLWS